MNKDMIDAFKAIDKETLLNAIAKADLIMLSSELAVEIYTVNCLFGSTDYNLHQNDTIVEAKELLNKLVEKLHSCDCKQNLNYYNKDSVIFDTIVYKGYRGGYKFSMAWKTKEGKKINTALTDFEYLMTSNF